VRANAYHHVALRVADLERSTRFYDEVFGGRVVVELELAPDFVESIFSAPPGSRGLNRVIDFGGWAIELFELVPGAPIPPTRQAEAGLMHYCVWVDDVPGMVKRVEAAGGQSRFPIRPWKGHHFVYVEDPDGHVIELLDATVEQCSSLTRDGSVPDHTAEVG
jgi:catechol 2,3-dioxygenase-like lactoylglutathione lyase family enzyme